ncbi:MAG: hypothetical protein LRZ84_14765 [Desertifilum sp.]|nr:hypothetical protein [Desertifilum sp.]
MPRLELQGDWNPEEVARITEAVKRTGDDFSALVGSLQSAVSPPVWDAYLGKSTQIDTDTGVISRLNSQNRWQPVQPAAPRPLIDIAYGSIQFSTSPGEYGKAVYLPVSDREAEGFKFRCRVEISTSELITSDEFLELDRDLTSDIQQTLDSRQIKGIIKMSGDRVILLVIRNPELIVPIGAYSSPQAPKSTDYSIANIEQYPTYLMLDIESDPDTDTLTKSIKKCPRLTFNSKSALSGTRLIKVEPKLDRQLVRTAIKQVELSGVDLSDIQINLVEGAPDFILNPEKLAGFTLPSDRIIHILPNDPDKTLRAYINKLSTRLRDSVYSDVLPGEYALEILTAVTNFSEVDWLVFTIQTLSGAIRFGDILTESNLSRYARYLELISARGSLYWGDRITVLRCLAEDYRYSVNPVIPNTVTVEWDRLIPANFRICQQVIKGL